MLEEIKRISNLMNDHAVILKDSGMSDKDLSSHVRSLKLTSVSHIDALIAASVATSFNRKVYFSEGKYIYINKKPFKFKVDITGINVTVEHEDDVEINNQKVMNEVLSAPAVTPLLTALSTCMSKGSEISWEEYSQIRHDLIIEMLKAGLSLTERLKDAQIVEE